MTTCIFLVALGWKVLPWVRTAWVKREEGAGTSSVVTVMGRAVAHAGCPGVCAGKAVREAGVSEGEKRGGKLVT